MYWLKIHPIEEYIRKRRERVKEKVGDDNYEWF